MADNPANYKKQKSQLDRDNLTTPKDRRPDNNATNTVSPNQEKEWEKALEAYQGPLPHPEDLERYKEVIGAEGVDYILKQADKEQDHRHQLEKEELKIEKEKQQEEINLVKRGQIFAFSVVFIAFACAFILVLLGHRLAATIFVGVTIVGIVTSFIESSDRKKTYNVSEQDNTEE